MSKKKSELPYPHLSTLENIHHCDVVANHMQYIKLIEIEGVLEDLRDKETNKWLKDCYQILINILNDPDLFPNRWCVWDVPSLQQNDRDQEYYAHLPGNKFQFNSQQHVDYLNAQEAKGVIK